MYKLIFTVGFLRKPRLVCIVELPVLVQCVSEADLTNQSISHFMQSLGSI
jgi:hypothetical protein